MLPPTVSPLGTPAGRLTATRVAAIIQSLLLYDEVWTAEITATTASGEPLPQEDLGAIGDLVAEMRRELDALTGPLFELSSIITASNPGTLDNALNELVRSGVLSEDASEPLQGDLQGSFIDAADYILANVEAEAILLDSQLAALGNGEAAHGDFGDWFWCSALVAGAGATVAATIATGGAVLVVGASVAGQLTVLGAGLKLARCLEKFPRLRFGH
jgi:hypothetical protein